MKTIFDIPHEILVEIILYLTPRERLVLSDSCVRFNSLVFEDKESLRHLDFSKPGHSTSDVDKYFQKEITCELIREVNLNNEIIAEHFSDACIAKAINLVDVNLHGIKIDIRRLEAILNPLQHLKRLSFKWREGIRRNFVNHDVIFRQRLSGLIYLSVDTMFDHLNPLILLLQSCQELKELHIIAIRCMFDENPILPEKFPLPKSIEIVDYSGFMVLKVKRKIRELLSNPEEWTDFRIMVDNRKFHIERNVQVCNELLDHGTIKCVRYDPEKNHCNVGRVIIAVDLLEEVVNLNHQNVPKKFCCLSRSGSSGVLTINDAKRLLKDSNYQLSSLTLHHKVEINCDVHLIASAFPYLTELVLSGIVSKGKFVALIHPVRDLIPDSAESTKVEKNFDQRLRRKDDLTDRRDSINLDSSFKMLVQNTPQLRHLTLKYRSSNTKRWDCDSLHLISDWKNLESLILSSVSLGDGSFLVEIGKQCRNLKRIDFSDRTYPPVSKDYEEQFLEMLKHCKNLKNISIHDYSLSKPSQMFFLLQNNPLIETIELCFTECEDAPVANLIFSIEQLLNRCSRLTRFTFRFNNIDNKLAEASQKLNSEQSQVTLKITSGIIFLFLTRG